MTRLMRMSIALSMLLSGISAPGSGALSADRVDADFASGSDEFGLAPNLRFPHFVPNSLRFWDFSKNWTTNFGPAYRDTIEALENLVPCTGRYALCFHSGAEPFPCEPDRSGRFVNCKCTVEEGLNFVLISAILNYEVDLEPSRCAASTAANASTPTRLRSATPLPKGS